MSEQSNEAIRKDLDHLKDVVNGLEELMFTREAAADADRIAEKLRVDQTINQLRHERASQTREAPASNFWWRRRNEILGLILAVAMVVIGCHIV